MVKEFEEGETYTNPAMTQDVMVLGISSSTKDQVVLAILLVDRDSKETTGGSQITVKTSDFGQWSEVEL